MLTVGIIGASGYAGVELVRILAQHPRVNRFVLSSTSFEGGRIESVYPNLLGRVSAELVKPEDVVDKRNMRFMGEGSGWNFIALEVLLGRGIERLARHFAVRRQVLPPQDIEPTE